jgi:acetyl-CoA/propionyl-CoA carboxylase biotin carboxyl carrier protein
MPEGPGVRVDAGVTSDTPLPAAYDPLLAKLMVHAEDRQAAVARLKRALAETAIGGLQTDLSFLRWLVDEPGFRAGAYDTGIVDASWHDGPSLSAKERSLAAALAGWARAQAASAPGWPSDGVVTAPSAWQRQARREAVDRRRPR